LGRKISSIRALVMDALAGIEATIDFTEDVSGHETPACPPQIYEAMTGINRLLSTYRQARLFTDGIQIVITGKPNVGKSSLLNSLAGRKKAIVTNIPGTTRDLITETIQLDGLSVHLTDTAGIRAPMDAIEKEGIDLVRERLEQADIIVILLDGSVPLTDEDRQILEENQKHAVRIIIAVNKSDLPSAWETGQLLEAAGSLSDAHLLTISAKFGDGLDALKKALADLTGSSETISDDGMITRLRHKLSLEKALDRLTAADKCISTGQSPEFAAFELHEALEALDEITGRKIQDDILHKIFSSFCIGK
ncbi:MAG: GTP-binding protein, partial [Smithellaceae bacterium]|nr:GTP-binding protein [Smithellaceae bacterium]